MSADNYIYVRKRNDGKFGVSMRFASDAYFDDPQRGEIFNDEVRVTPAPEDHYGAFDTVQEAVMAAHRAYREEAVVEYGVYIDPTLSLD